MLQSKAVAVFLILLLGSTLTGVGAKTISKRHTAGLSVPDIIAFYVYKAVEYVSPESAKMLAKAAETPLIRNTRNFLRQTTDDITLKAEEAWNKVVGKIYGFWRQQEKEPEQQ